MNLKQLVRSGFSTRQAQALKDNGGLRVPAMAPREAYIYREFSGSQVIGSSDYTVVPLADSYGAVMPDHVSMDPDGGFTALADLVLYGIRYYVEFASASNSGVALQILHSSGFGWCPFFVGRTEMTASGNRAVHQSDDAVTANYTAFIPKTAKLRMVVNAADKALTYASFDAYIGASGA